MDMLKLSTIYKELISEENNASYLLTVGQAAIDEFQTAIPIFTNIKLELSKKRFDTVGEYQYGSAINGCPIIYLQINGIKDIEEDELDFVIRMTVFHELGHAMCNIDNYYIFDEDNNILQYEDEEKFVEDFAFDFEMFQKIPESVFQLMKLYKNKQWIGVDDEDEEDNDF